MTNSVDMTVAVELFPLEEPFVITGYVMHNAPAVTVRLVDGQRIGRGEAAGVYYFNESADKMQAAIEALRPTIEAGIGRDELGKLLPAGGARNALDCALWELEARRAGSSVSKLAGLEQAPKPLLTTYTLGAALPEAMAMRAKLRFAGARALKLKLTGELDLDLARVAAVRAARPDCWIGVDANQGYRPADLDVLIRGLVEHDVRLLEQPLPRGMEAEMAGLVSPIPVAADESVQTFSDIAGLKGLFDVINIKLDKSGGLTEALAMVRESRALGFEVMVGNMLGSSLAMAPAYIVGQFCDYVDLDGPLGFLEDVKPSVRYVDGFISCGDQVWGS